MSLTVACVWVRGHVPFTAEYVVRLEAMVRRFIDRDFTFVCLTDKPSMVPDGIQTIRVPSPGELKGWWSKLQLFSPSNGLTGRVLYLDLDTLVVAPLQPIIDYPATFALIPHSGRFEGTPGRAVVKVFNSSVMVWDAGEPATSSATTDLFRRWTPDVAKRLHGDQDWIGEQARSYARPMPLAWFPRLSEIQGPPFPDEAKVILAKKPKNLEAAKQWPWFAEAWSMA